MKKMITNFGFSMSSWEDNRVNPMICYEISGKENLEKWMSVITPNNPVHVSKYLFWKKFGYYEPKSTLQARLDALNLNTTCFFKEIDLPR